MSNILFTGTSPDFYHHLGEIIHFPMITIQPFDFDPVDISQYDVLLFTSRFAVVYFFDVVDPLSVEAMTIIAIGETTANELEVFDLAADLIPEEETSEGLFDAISKSNFPINHRQVLFPRSALSNPYLKENLQVAGATVKELVVYDNIKPPFRPLPKGQIDKILFTSPSCVVNFMQDYGSIPEEWQILAKGPRTRRELLDIGYQSEIIP